MSGIEPLAALGLVCNILQLIEIGSQTYDLIKAVYRGGSIDDSLNQKAVILGNVSEDIKPVNYPANRREQQLVETAESCARVARQLREEIIHLIGNAKKGRLSSSVSAAVRTLWRKPRLERLKNELDEAEKLMQTGLLAQIMSTVNNTKLDLSDLGADIRFFVQEYWKGHRDTKTLVSCEGLETRTHVSNVIQGTNKTIEKLSQDLGMLTFNVDVQVDQAIRERLLQSLKYPGFNERRNEVREAHPATFQWVFAGDDGQSAGPESRMKTVKWDSFSNWLKSTDTVYWISGKPGSGKSTMVKYILADPQIQATQHCLDIWSPGCLIISHYFWRPGNPMQRSIKGVLCSLLSQLLGNSETALARALTSVTWSKMKDDVTDWSLEELQSTLLSTMKAYDRPVCVFLDGLDEVYPDQPTTLLDMVKKLSAAGKTKICLASRPEPPLQRRLYNMPQFRLQDLNAADLTQYVHDHIQISKFPNLKDYGDFVKRLVKRAEGVFLWLVLVTKSVQTGFDNGDTIEIINERVNGLQGGDLESLYKDMWDRVSEDNPDTYRRTAALYFRIMLLYIRNQYLQIYGQNLSIFTMMLASTELAEKTLNAAPQTPNLVPEETLLQGCKEVERIAGIYCFGLIEVSESHGNSKMVGWYRGDYDRLLPYAQVRKALTFIHRTAVDFLVNTAQGKEILSFDDTAESSHAFRLVSANLAHAQLFSSYAFKVRGSLASAHLQSIDGVRTAYIGADESVIAEYTRTVMHCKRLFDFEKIFSGKHTMEALICSGKDFFKEAARTNWRCLVIFETQIKALDKETLSEMLHILCCQFSWGVAGLEMEPFDGRVLRLISVLLTAGADPNWNATSAFANTQWKRGGLNRHTFPSTAFMEFLTRILGRALMEQTLLKQAKLDKYRALREKFCKAPDFAEMLATLQTFIRWGADLDDKVAMFFDFARVQPSTAESPDTFQRFRCRLLSQCMEWEHASVLSEEDFKDKHGYICSFPAHDILKLVISEWEPLRLLPKRKALLADIKSFFACNTGRRNRETDFVLERLETTDFATPSPGGETATRWKWYVAPREHQEQIAKELLSLMTLSEGSVDIYQGQSSAATQALGYETLISMLCGPHWVEKGSGSLESVFDHLVELGLFARHSESFSEEHTIRGWLELKGFVSASCWRIWAVGGRED